MKTLKVDVARGAGQWQFVTVVAVLVTTVLAVAGYALIDYAVEEYWIWRLRHSDSELDRVQIAKKLGVMGSVRAIPEMLNACDRLSPIRGAGYLAPTRMHLALVGIGDPALPSLLSAMAYDTGYSRYMIPKAVFRILQDHHPTTAKGVGPLVRAGHSLDEAILLVLSEDMDVSARVSHIAAETLRSLKTTDALPR